MRGSKDRKVQERKRGKDMQVHQEVAVKETRQIGGTNLRP